MNIPGVCSHDEGTKMTVCMFRPQDQPDPDHGQTDQAALQLPLRERPDQPGPAQPDPAGQSGRGGSGLCRSPEYSREDTGSGLSYISLLSLISQQTQLET